MLLKYWADLLHLGLQINTKIILYIYHLLPKKMTEMGFDLKNNNKSNKKIVWIINQWILIKNNIL